MILRIGGIAFAAAVVFGCSKSEPTVVPAEPTAIAERAAPGAPAAPVRPLPPRGEATLSFADNLVTVDAYAAPRLPLLQQLAHEGGFVLDARANAWPELTLRLERAPLELALPLLVGDLTYSTEWKTANGMHRLAKLRVGAPRVVEASDSIQAPAPGDVSASLERAIAARREQPLSQAETEAEAARYADPDPEQRLRAALALEPEGEQLKQLCDMLEHDPDPRVRAATTVNIENADQFSAVRALVDALDDPDPDVLIEVIDSLEFAGDQSISPEIESLLSHSDPRVRQAAADALIYFGR